MLAVNILQFEANKEDRQPFNLTSEKLRALEETSTLTPGEKIDIILIAAGKKMVSEVGLNNKDTTLAERFLDDLGMAWQHEEHGERGRWITIATNRALLKYVNERREILSEVEIGALYGFPVTHSLAFTGVFDEKNRTDKTIQGFYLGGVYSEKYFDNEKSYFDDIWKSVVKISPAIEKQAIEYFKESKSQN